MNTPKWTNNSPVYRAYVAASERCAAAFAAPAPAQSLPQAQPADRRPALDKRHVARLGEGYSIAGPVEAGPCELCQDECDTRRVAFLLADGGTLAAHDTCGSRAISTVRERRTSAADLRNWAEAWGHEGAPAWGEPGTRLVEYRARRAA